MLLFATSAVCCFVVFAGAAATFAENPRPFSSVNTDPVDEFRTDYLDKFPSKGRFGFFPCVFFFILSRTRLNKPKSTKLL